MNKVMPTVLIVEDDPIIASDIKLHLTRNGYKIIAILSYGFEAVEVAREKKPDLVLLDIMLKGYMNGIEAAEIISKKLKIPVIFLTALTDDETFLSARAFRFY
jgi:CheY-like chemotaxis protein